MSSPTLEGLCSDQFARRVASTMGRHRSRSDRARMLDLEKLTDEGMKADLIAISPAAPKWVVKVFPDNDGYLAFVRAVFLNEIQSVHFPIVKRLVKLDNHNWLAVIERLDTYGDGDVYMAEESPEYRQLRYLVGLNGWGGTPGLLTPHKSTVNTPPHSLVVAMEQITQLYQKYDLSDDMHSGNFMMRGDCVVITDPFTAPASGPQQRERHLYLNSNIGVGQFADALEEEQNDNLADTSDSGHDTSSVSDASGSSIHSYTTQDLLLVSGSWLLSEKAAQGAAA